MLMNIYLLFLETGIQIITSMNMQIQIVSQMPRRRFRRSSLSARARYLTPLVGTHYLTAGARLIPPATTLTYQINTK